MTALSVNLNLIAQMRNRRNLGFPSVEAAARTALTEDADGITVHPRPDERHIRAADVAVIAAEVARWPGRELNIEGNPLHNLLDVLRALKASGGVAHQATFVPDGLSQSTSDHGWDIARDGATLAPLIAQVRAMGLRVSLFMDAATLVQGDTAAQVARLGAQRVELYTEPYAVAYAHWQQHNDAASRSALDLQLNLFEQAAQAAVDAGLGVNAGHDLNQHNLPPFVHVVPQVQEVSIGHALVCDALDQGLAHAVRAYRHCLAPRD